MEKLNSPEQAAQDSLQQGRDVAPAATSESAALQSGDGDLYGSSPRQVAQRQARDRLQNSSRQAAQRQHLETLQRAPSEHRERKSAPAGGLPENLKSGIESLSGISMDPVRVHYNSAKPAQLNALAYAQGTDIHLGPGQEKHLPHEAWHVVQQAQGRVQPTMQMRDGAPINDNKSLEHEADAMGSKAMQLEALPVEKSSLLSAPEIPTNLGPLQRKVAVKVAEKSKTKVVISAKGKARNFQGGTEAEDYGWNGVTKYQARAKVGETEIKTEVINNRFIEAQAGHVLAKQNGGNGAQSANVFAQEAGVNNGYYRRAFEGPMRDALENVNGETTVRFRVALYGEDIRLGPLKKELGDLVASPEPSDFEGFSSDPDSDRNQGSGSDSEAAETTRAPRAPKKMESERKTSSPNLDDEVDFPPATTNPPRKKTSRSSTRGLTATSRSARRTSASPSAGRAGARTEQNASPRAATTTDVMEAPKKATTTKKKKSNNKTSTASSARAAAAASSSASDDAATVNESPQTPGSKKKKATPKEKKSNNKASMASSARAAAAAASSASDDAATVNEKPQRRRSKRLAASEASDASTASSETDSGSSSAANAGTPTATNKKKHRSGGSNKA